MSDLDMSDNLTSSPPTRGRKRALLIASQLPSLCGQANDLNTMGSVLRSYGFVSTRCFSPGLAPCTATRAGILEAWEALINDTCPGDAVVIYYSGHASVIPFNTSSPWTLAKLGWATGGASPAQSCRISSPERPRRRQTQPSSWTTAILRAWRGAKEFSRLPTTKTPDNDAYRMVLAHIDKMMDNGKFDTDLHHEKNPDAVFIIATPQIESAYERTIRSYASDGSLVEYTTGVLTNALAAALTEAIPESVCEAGQTEVSWRPNVSWRSVMLNVRDRIKLDFPSQVPQIEANDLRFTFCLDHADSRGILSLSTDRGHVTLSGGRLHNISKGDVYSVQPFKVERVAHATEITRAMVQEVGPLTSRVTLSPDTVLPAGAKAFPVKTAPATFQVDLDAAGRLAGRLADELKKSEHVRPRRQAHLPVMASVSLRGSRLSLRSHYGGGHHLLREWDIPEGQAFTQIRDCTDMLENLAWAQHLLMCRFDLGEDVIARHLKVEFGLVDINGNRQPLVQTRTPEVIEGQKLYVEMTSISEGTLYVSIFDVCTASVTLLTTSSPDGIKLANYGSYVFGKAAFETKVKGQATNWPDATPKGSPIPEDLVLVVTDREMDLRSLETGHQHRIRKSGEAETKLTKLIDRIGTGSRKVETEDESPVRFGILRLPFTGRSYNEARLINPCR
ncbi:hypothetical protein B0J13DRAFT_607974 [Dactylonectria estremocensis]|uniref:Caspase domain-containing protein n=1 Tax=Dactylonectria estremocensis TaxID=1079267 RepID=A0A9P9J018_9HYPO|nr:hypothetical protein B0J13DRAFT_607974 [Dactylonectria estremocensis]